MPLLLYGFDAERKYLWQARPVSNGQAILISLVLAIVFETVFPYLSEGFTGDWRDVIAYFTGTGLYLIFRAPRSVDPGIEGSNK